MKIDSLYEDTQKQCSDFTQTPKQTIYSRIVLKISKNVKNKYALETCFATLDPGF